MSDRDQAYDQMLRLADLFDTTGQEMRGRAGLGLEILRDEAVADSADLSKATYDAVAEDIRNATTGRHGLLTRSIELDADALVVRATVLTYRWIDDLQDAAYETLGAIAGRAIGYLAPSVALGGAIVSAGLIETDALDRDGIAGYLDELAVANPDLMDHVASGGGGLVEALQLRSLLTSGLLAGDSARLAAAGGLRAIGIEPFAALTTAAVRDVAGPVVAAEEAGPEPEGVTATRVPRGLEDLMSTLTRAPRVTVHRVGEHRFIAYLPGPGGGGTRGSAGGRRLRLVGGDPSAYTARALAEIEAAVAGTPGASVMLVGAAAGGIAAAEIAAAAESASFTVDQVVTAGAPSAQVPRLPEATRMLSLEDRDDPVALLGSLLSVDAANRVVVVFDRTGSAHPDDPGPVAGGRAADRSDHVDLRAELERIKRLGYLAG